MKKLSQRKVDSNDIHDSSVDMHMLIMRQNSAIYRLHKEIKKKFLDHIFEGRRYKAEEE
jgi:hypothetical protein